MILSKLIYPWDEAEQRPCLSANGKYIARLNFNGCYRRVTIDDRLPVSRTKRILHIIDRNNPSALWPALVEKAYLKMRGGYDFPGSNSSTDLFILTGWIPEQVILQDEDTEPKQVWKRMHGAFQFGDVLVTMGTGKMSSRVERELGLAGHHDYAVLDLKEDGERQLVLMKNPWIQGEAWKGNIPGPMTLDPSPTRPADIGKSSNTSPTAMEQLSDSLADASISQRQQESNLPPGTFWIDWNNVMQHFESAYLNWNPSLFSHRQDIHFAWDLATQRSASGNFARNPQFAVNARDKGTLWLLLCRHFQDTTTHEAVTSDTDTITNTSKPGEFTGHISLYVYENNGKKVQINNTPMDRTQYVDSPQTLLRVDVTQATTFTAVVSEQNLRASKHSFSLTAYSSMPVALSEASPSFPFSTSVSSAWTSSTAGGGAHLPTFFRNPQFSLSLPSAATLSLLLETFEPELNVHVKLCHSAGGTRVAALARRDIIADSAQYRRGSAFALIPRLDPGCYTIVASTFDAGQKAAFALRVDATAAPALRQLPALNAGRIETKLRWAWFDERTSKIAMPLFPRRLVRLSAVVRGLPSSAKAEGVGPAARRRSPVRISLEVGRGPGKRVVKEGEGGEFMDADGVGVGLGEVDVWPEMGAEPLGPGSGSGSGSGLGLGLGFGAEGAMSSGGNSMGMGMGMGMGVGMGMVLVLERMGSPSMAGEEGYEVFLSCDGRPDELLAWGEWRNWDD